MYKVSDFSTFFGPAIEILRIIRGFSWNLSADLSRYFVRSAASKQLEHIYVRGFGSSGMWVSVNPYWGFSLPWLRFFRAFSSVIRKMPGYNLQRRCTTRTLPKLSVFFYVLFVCKCVLYYCHRVSTQLQLTNISTSINQILTPRDIVASYSRPDRPLKTRTPVASKRRDPIIRWGA